MVASALALLPTNTSILHIGLFREKASLQPVEYYSKLSAQPSVDQVLILDPLVATGGTVIACVSMMLDWGLPIEKIRFAGVLGSEPGVRELAQRFPGLEIWYVAFKELEESRSFAERNSHSSLLFVHATLSRIGHVDPELSQPEGYILPGLGDMVS